MQYVGQTCRFLKTRFTEQCRSVKKPRKLDTFLFLEISNAQIISPSHIYIQPVEKILYGENSS